MITVLQLKTLCTKMLETLMLILNLESSRFEYEKFRIDMQFKNNLWLLLWIILVIWLCYKFIRDPEKENVVVISNYVIYICMCKFFFELVLTDKNTECSLWLLLLYRSLVWQLPGSWYLVCAYRWFAYAIVAVHENRMAIPD